MSYYGPDSGFKPTAPPGIEGGLARLLPALNVNFAKVVVLTLLVVVLLIWSWEPARKYTQDPDTLKKVATGLGVSYLILLAIS